MGAVDRILVEEGSMQGRPYRRYNDGSYKAASSDGWLQFDNIESLVEYHRTRSTSRSDKKIKSGLLRSLISKIV